MQAATGEKQLNGPTQLQHIWTIKMISMVSLQLSFLTYILFHINKLSEVSCNVKGILFYKQGTLSHISIGNGQNYFPIVTSYHNSLGFHLPVHC